MGSTSKHGRAVINARAPEALGICDRCGFLYNLRSLRFQWDWAGSGMVNRQIRVCTGPGTRRCYDLPQEQLRSIILPPDPMPARNPRPEPYGVDEASEYDLRPPIGKPYMFMASGDVIAALSYGVNLSALIDAVGDVVAVLSHDAQMSASIDGISDVTCELDVVSSANFIATEGDDQIITEGGDNLITET